MQHINRTETGLSFDWIAKGSKLSKDHQQAREGYWNQFYLNGNKFQLHPPSQFAAFIASEYDSFPLIIDVGCGNGRDTLFFAQLGHETIGIDASETAISVCERSIAGDQKDKHRFMLKNVTELAESDNFIQSIISRPKLIYSRFFLHAVDESEEKSFFDFAFKCAQPSDVIAIEFRSHWDKNTPKMTNTHYRRYINPELLISNVINDYSCQLEYFACGVGMAKYKQDDAHVARIIFQKI